MGLHIREGAAKGSAGAFDRDPLEFISVLGAGVEALPRIANDGLVGEDRALRTKHGTAHKIFRGNEFDCFSLPSVFGRDKPRDDWIDLRTVAHEIAWMQPPGGVLPNGRDGSDS